MRIHKNPSLPEEIHETRLDLEHIVKHISNIGRISGENSVVVHLDLSLVRFPSQP